MVADPDASRLSMLGRALRRRCPRCGTPAFESFYTMVADCSGCGLHFEREQGYWVGALIINTTVVFGAFLVIFVGGMAILWPDVPWGALMAVTLGVMAILPIVFYPFSKTIWMALELSWHPLEQAEIEEALRRAGNH